MGFNLDNLSIAKTEQLLDFEFSSSYKERMSYNNGGEITIQNEGWFLLPIFDNSDKKRLKRTFNDIIKETRLFHSEYSNFHSYIPFAYNGTGDYLVFNKNSKTKIFIFFHEYKKIKKIAEDFTELL